jgi:SAM-dependent methyltransferase
MVYTGEIPVYPTVVIGRPGLVRDLDDFILARVAGKSVLNVGAAGNMQAYLPHRAELSTHVKVMKAAREVVGIDVDRRAIAHAKNHGVEILERDCETLDLGTTFDVILWLDVIEHLDRPADALIALMKHLNTSGELILTTFNATFIGVFIDSIFKRNVSVYYDHVGCYMPEHVAVLASRHGYRASEFYFYTRMNTYTRAATIKSHVIRTIGFVFPRFNNAFIAVIRR